MLVRASGNSPAAAAALPVVVVVEVADPSLGKKEWKREELFRGESIVDGWNRLEREREREREAEVGRRLKRTKRTKRWYGMGNEKDERYQGSYIGVGKREQ